jgi:hypothetical protein
MEKLRKFETEEELFNDTSSEYPTVAYTEDTDKVWVKEELKEIKIYGFKNCFDELPPFTINAFSSMTWEEWFNSEYYDNRLKIWYFNYDDKYYVVESSSDKCLENDNYECIDIHDFINKSEYYVGCGE